MTSLSQSAAVTLDHIGIVSRDMTALREAYLRLGFTVSMPAPLMQPTADGAGKEWIGQYSAHIIFSDSYLELAAVPPEVTDNHLLGRLSKREGLHIVALRTNDAVSSCADLASAFPPSPELRKASREVSVGSTHATALFTWFMLPDPLAQVAFGCVVKHHTPELVFAREFTTHANGARNLRRLHAIVPDPEQAAAHYLSLPGAKIERRGRGCAVVLGDREILLSDASAFAQVFPGAQIPMPPSVGGYTLTVENVAAAAAVLTANQIPFERCANGFWIKPEHAGGAVLEFKEEDARP